MERKIGEIFEHNNVLLKTVEGYNCWGCYMFRHGGCFDVENHGDCSKIFRTDKRGVIFKLVDMCKNKEEKRNVELTLNKAKEWYKQGGELKEVALQAFSESELNDNRSHSWREFCEKNHIDYNTTLNEHRPYGNVLVNFKYPTKEYAAASVALCQLLQLRQEWIGNWKPDWRDNSEKYVVSYYCDILQVLGGNYHYQEVLTFPEHKMAEEFLCDFRDLLEIAKPLL